MHAYISRESIKAENATEQQLSLETSGPPDHLAREISYAYYRPTVTSKAYLRW